MQNQASQNLFGAFGGEIDTASLFSSVLLVEDEEAHAHLISRALSGVVGEVVHVSNGAAALQTIESTMIELVLCDLNLPDVSGVQLLRAIHEARPDLPVIVMTASSSLEDAVNAMREGAWDYMVKQFSSDLVERVTLLIVRTAERKLQQMRELQVRAERDAFWAAVRTAQDGVAILGSAGHIVFANDRFTDFCTLAFGGTMPEKGTDLAALLELSDPRVAESLRAQIKGQIKGQVAESLWSSEIRVPVGPESSKADNARYYELTLSSVSTMGFSEVAGNASAMSELRRYVCWAHDITRRKGQEKFQRDLLSTTTHDLKGPLGAILTSAELLGGKSAINQPRMQDLITRIASCARNSINLIDELLSARRIQDGVLVVRPHSYSAKEVLEDVVLDYLPVARGKNIDFHAAPSADDLQIYADKLGLNRVLGNLVSNAIKYTGKGGRVVISAERAGDAVQISVSDTGSGIDSKNRARLFERYTRLDQHQSIEGTGLGLYVTKNIVDAHNGRIEVTSELGVGTTFSVFFPNAPTEAAQQSATSAV